MLRNPQNSILRSFVMTYLIQSGALFLLKSIIELFANGRQVMGLRVYPDRQDSVGVSVRAFGSDALLRSVDAWQMRSIYD